MKNKLSLIIPCYNEQEVLHQTANVLLDKLNFLIANKKISPESKIIFIDDGSEDKTWEIIQALNSQNKIFWGIKLSRNFGHQNALLCGLMTAKNFFDITISIDADLQDDINLIDLMLEKYFLGGNQIVYGVRDSRKSDSFFKKITAECFYKLLKFLGADIIFNHADFRLMSKKVLDEYEKFPEVNLFLRGTVKMLGFKSCILKYERKKRLAGKSKYNLKKMMILAWDGITSTSIKPIRFITAFGFFVAWISFFTFFAYPFFITKMHYDPCNDYNITVLYHLIVLYNPAFFFLGLLFVAVGIVGEYVAKTYLETKQRPKFIIEDFLN